MATLLSQSSVAVGYVAEVTPGTTPATPAFNQLPITDFTLALTKDVFTDPTIQSDRQNHYVVHGNRKVNGEVSGSLLSCGATPTGNTIWDPLWESLFNNAWLTNSLIIGNVNKSFTFSKRLTDGTISYYFRYKGVQVTGATLDIALTAPAKVKFTLAGLDAPAVVATNPDTATEVSEPAGPQPLIHSNANNTFKIGANVAGLAATTLMTAFNLSIQNNSNVNYALGSGIGQSITSSKAAVTGTATFYFADIVLYNTFVADSTPYAIEVKLSDTVPKSLTILLPRVIFGAATQVIANDNTAIVTMPFTATFDTATNTSVKLTRA